MDNKQTNPIKGVKPYRIEFNKSPLHRYISADGQWIGLNGYGKIILNFFNDSPPLPKSMVLEARTENLAFTNKEPQVIFHEGEAYRQFEVSVVINLYAAKQLQNSLAEFIKMAEQQSSQLQT